MIRRSKNFSSRILLIVIFSFAITSFYYVYTLYKNKIESAEEGALERLEGIANTLASQLNGTMYKMILDMHESKNAVKTKYDGGSYYREMVEVLERTADLNELPTDIYTLTYDSISDVVFFGMTSGPNQYFRHIYEDPPDILKKKYNEGAIIPSYKDENGTWLSAFSPFKRIINGNTIGVVQVDLPFDHFIDEARSDLYQNLTFNFLLNILIAILLYYWLNTLLGREEKYKSQLSYNNEIIRKKNEDITASISYAQRIQTSLMDSENKLKSLFPSSFVVYKPKDIVSGDFYWIQRLNESGSKIAIAAADCTGHGVPGALVSVLGITHLREIVVQNDSIEPGEILKELNIRIIDTFTTKSGVQSKDGMDISLTVIDKEEGTMCFAGAYRPLILIRNGEIKEIAGDKQPIGGDHFVKEREFTNHKLDFRKGDWLYMFSDGYVDQFGGDNNRKFMKKRFKNLLCEIVDKDCDDQKKVLEDELEKWMGDIDQIDDITVIGMELN